MSDQSGDGAVVTLSADAAPFERALAKAEGVMGRWADKTSKELDRAMKANPGQVDDAMLKKAERLMQVNDKLRQVENRREKERERHLKQLEKEEREHEQRLEKERQQIEKKERERKDKLNRIGSMLAGEQLFQASGRYDMMKNSLREALEEGPEGIGQRAGSGLGASLGQAAGVAFGGPFGMMAGNLLGGALGDTLGKVLGKGLGKAFTEDTWLRDAKVSGGRIWEKLFDAADWNDILTSPLDQAWEKVQKKAGEVWAEIETFGDKSLYRITQAIDLLWSAVREPAAIALNWIQEIGEKLGLVEQGSLKWGDALKSVQNVGEKVVGAIAYGLGWLEGLFIKLGGIITKHLIAPLTTGLGSAIQTASLAVGALTANLDPVLKAAFAAKTGISLDTFAAGLGKVGDRLTKAGAGLAVAGEAMAAVDPKQRAEDWRQAAIERIRRGEEAIRRDAPVREAPIRAKAEAAVVGSREDQRLRVQATVTDSQLKALEKLGRAADDARGQRDTLIDLGKQVIKALGGGQVLKQL